MIPRAQQDRYDSNLDAIYQASPTERSATGCHHQTAKCPFRFELSGLLPNLHSIPAGLSHFGCSCGLRVREKTMEVIPVKRGERRPHHVLGRQVRRFVCP